MSSCYSCSAFLFNFCCSFSLSSFLLVTHNFENVIEVKRFDLYSRSLEFQLHCIKIRIHNFFYSQYKHNHVTNKTLIQRGLRNQIIKKYRMFSIIHIHFVVFIYLHLLSYILFPIKKLHRRATRTRRPPCVAPHPAAACGSCMRPESIMQSVIKLILS